MLLTRQRQQETARRGSQASKQLEDLPAAGHPGISCISHTLLQRRLPPLNVMQRETTPRPDMTEVPMRYIWGDWTVFFVVGRSRVREEPRDFRGSRYTIMKQARRVAHARSPLVFIPWAKHSQSTQTTSTVLKEEVSGMADDTQGRSLDLLVAYSVCGKYSS